MKTSKRERNIILHTTNTWREIVWEETNTHPENSHSFTISISLTNIHTHTHTNTLIQIHTHTMFRERPHTDLQRARTIFGSTPIHIRIHGNKSHLPIFTDAKSEKCVTRATIHQNQAPQEWTRQRMPTRENGAAFSVRSSQTQLRLRHESFYTNRLVLYEIRSALFLWFTW